MIWVWMWRCERGMVKLPCTVHLSFPNFEKSWGRTVFLSIHWSNLLKSDYNLIEMLFATVVTKNLTWFEFECDAVNDEWSSNHERFYLSFPNHEKSWGWTVFLLIHWSNLLKSDCNLIEMLFATVLTRNLTWFEFECDAVTLWRCERGMVKLPCTVYLSFSNYVEPWGRRVFLLIHWSNLLK